jgi:D-amino-acid dehydrogenase
LKIAVLGGGVIGVTTAYYLSRDGHDVELFESRAGPGEETSFANAGEVSPGYASPWAGPGVPLKAVKWLTMRHGPLAIRPKLDPAMWMWMLQMLRNCTSARYARNKARMVPLAEYSRDALRELRRETGITYDERSRGTLQLFRQQKQLDGAGFDIEILRQFGVPFEVLDRAGCIAAEPALGRGAETFVGGLRLPGDETGDCYKFTTRLAALAQRNVSFRFGMEVVSVEPQASGLVRVNTAKSSSDFNAVVVALGCHSAALSRTLGLRLPIYPVKGYSLTYRIDDAEAAPVSTVMDETYKIAITRLGDRIRVGGTAELAGFDLTLRASRRSALEHSVNDLFGQAGDSSRATFWCGLRPMTPDGPPLVGPTRIPGVYLNSGHGTLGWTMACGSALTLADVIAGRRPAIDVGALSLERYR